MTDDPVQARSAGALEHPDQFLGIRGFYIWLELSIYYYFLPLCNEVILFPVNYGITKTKKPMQTKQLIEAFKNAKAGFIAFPYTNKQNETSKRTIYIGASYENAKQKDIDTISNFLLATDLGYVPSEKYTRADWHDALNELLSSLKNTDVKRSQGQQDAYISITENGTIKWNIETQELYIQGLNVKKTITEDGIYKEVNSAPKTIAKNVIRYEYLSTGKWRTFKVRNLEGNIRINNDTLEIE
ncbi:MAG: hypothetical protein Q8O88_03995 [bacterium]|nr:hypothetical protein [bacterium]